MRNLRRRPSFALTFAVLFAAACGGRSPLVDDLAQQGATTGAFGSGGSAAEGQGGGPIGSGGATVGTGGATVGKGGAPLGTGGGTVGTGGAVVGGGPGTGGAPVGGGPGTGGAPVGGGPGTGGAPQACFQGAVCAPGASCFTPGPPGCVNSCSCDGGGHFQCGESCMGMTGTGGSPSSCSPGAKCAPGVGCVAPVPGQPNCQYQCSCSGSGSYQCSEGCSTTGPGPVGTGGGPGACLSCVGSVLSTGICAQQESQCGPGCNALAKCAAQAGCFGAVDLVLCAAQAGCKITPNAVKELILVVDCAECNGCVGSCPIAPGQCGMGPMGPGPVGTGGGPPQCASCVNGVVQSGSCQPQVSDCLNTPGCAKLAQCYQAHNCVDAFDPLACGAMGCPGASPAAKAALTGILQCAECGNCAGQCSGFGVCSAGAGGSPAGPGTMGVGGSGPVTCNDCVQQAQTQGTCQPQIQECVQNPDCQALLTCQNNCADKTCVDGCKQQHPKGVPGYDGILYCLGCVACGTQCVNDVPPGFCQMPPPPGG